MDEKQAAETASAKKPRRVSRRNFIGAVGGAAVAGALLQRGHQARAQNLNAQTFYYQDSFGNVVPAGQTAISLGVYPPPVPSSLLPPGGANPDNDPGPTGTTFYTSGNPQYNILMIVVDQMRNPNFWLPGGSGGQAAVNAAIPNISQLAAWSFAFPNYWVAATVCSPSRACLLTGLYTQQNCIFKVQQLTANDTTNNNYVSPPLLPYNPSWGANNSSNNSSNNNASPGFPTIANVLAQAIQVGNNSSNTISFDCTWIGKWHLSCHDGNSSDTSPGRNGPSDYGFNAKYSVPTANTANPYPAGSLGLGYPSPNGWINQGTGGDYLDSTTSTRDVPNWPAILAYTTADGCANNNNIAPAYLTELSDAGIANAFSSVYLPWASINRNNNVSGQLTTPWFCAVSFINPHDITDFPWAYGQNNSSFGSPSNSVVCGTTGFQPPPSNSSSPVTYYGNSCGNNMQCANNGDMTVIPGNNVWPYSALPPGTGNNGGQWNWENQTALLYSATGGKPNLQKYFQDLINLQAGAITGPGTYNNSNNNWSNPTGWLTFLNYYLWMQSCVDYYVGVVLGLNYNNNNASPTYQPWMGLQQYSTFWDNTVVIFTADHGDYGGSHGLHAKGGGLYEEVMNVPLYISYPSMRSSNNNTQLPYSCSSVDVLPFLYTLALGNHSWRNNNNDMVYYLSNRESIYDAIMEANNNNTGVLPERRISGVPLYAPPGGCSIGNSSCHPWQLYQPYVLHTADDFEAASIGGKYVPSHAIAFRTIDQTDPNSNSSPFDGSTQGGSYGGGKLGIYGFWDTCNQNTAPIMPTNSPGGNSNTPDQYEFYNYSIHPYEGGVTANPQELGNQYFNNDGSHPSNQAQLYGNSFGSNGVQNELYQLYTYNSSASGNNATQQVGMAIQTAYNNYLAYLNASGLITGNNNNGPIAVGSCPSGNTCPNCTGATGAPTYNP